MPFLTGEKKPLYINKGCTSVTYHDNNMTCHNFIFNVYYKSDIVLRVTPLLLSWMFLDSVMVTFHGAVFVTMASTFFL